ncbi:hypothetical protein EJ07DRAFT_155169 [Lizonia empirigonia]|nr:hypothetical protein EJ07DRAFT_155169 [Lizonia empirigonia]
MEAYRRHELPETVKRYKSHTDEFQSWLVKIAAQRNIEHTAHIIEQARNSKANKAHSISIEQQMILIDRIAATKQPLQDTSGFRYLQDALRYRKEVTQYYKTTGMADDGHYFFNEVLEGFLARLKLLVLKSHGLKDEARSYVPAQVVPDINSDDDDTDESNHYESPQRPTPHLRSHSSSSRIQHIKPLTGNDLESQRTYRILVFLFDLNQIRHTVLWVWSLCCNGSLSAVTAALVTDLAQSHIQQYVAALLEEIELDSDGHHLLADKVEHLYAQMLTEHDESPVSDQLSKSILRQVFCIDAIDLWYTYTPSTPKRTQPAASSDPACTSSFLPLLQSFENVRQGEFKLPIWDKFTEDMVQRPRSANQWLPFGLQILLDVEQISAQENNRIVLDLTEHALDLSDLLRLHVEYENSMWAKDRMPDYMAKEETKLSSSLLPEAPKLLDWVHVLLRTAEESDLEINSSHRLIATHPTLAGLSTWQFHNFYHSTSISKVQWFIIALSHLYNATRKLGLLELEWPDLEFIIKTNGPQRIFVGDPPTSRDEFEDRYRLATCTTSRTMASDYRAKGKYQPGAPNMAKKKRGLRPNFPLQQKIKAYYGPGCKEDRWLKRHAIFNYLELLGPANRTITDTKEQAQKLENLQEAFALIASKIDSPEQKERGRKPSLVPNKDFPKAQDTHSLLLVRMTEELSNHEVHSNFDHLSFFRRGQMLLQLIRSDVLDTLEIQRARLDDMKKRPNLSNTQLLVDLFARLKTKSKSRKSAKVIKNDAKRPTNASSLKQLQRIGELMAECIRNEGSVELDRANLRTKGDWTALRASYKAEGLELELQATQEDHPSIRPSDAGDVPQTSGNEVKSEAKSQSSSTVSGDGLHKEKSMERSTGVLETGMKSRRLTDTVDDVNGSNLLPPTNRLAATIDSAATGISALDPVAEDRASLKLLEEATIFHSTTNVSSFDPAVQDEISLKLLEDATNRERTRKQQLAAPIVDTFTHSYTKADKHFSCGEPSQQNIQQRSLRHRAGGNISPKRDSKDFQPSTPSLHPAPLPPHQAPHRL